MNRREQIEEASKKHYQDRPEGFGEPYFDFEAGAEWADANPSTSYHAVMGDYHFHVLKQKLAIAVEALEFISEEKTYCNPDGSTNKFPYCWKYAKEALEKIKGEK